ncbi:MAG: BON domain-containing protein [Gemmatimonadetes bacterium]|nr:BON domain-containing protein [Gemmatimonadota bacterium]
MERRWLVLAALAIGAGESVGPGCRQEEDPLIRHSLSEATITAEVRSRIVASEGLASLPVAVETRDGIVRLSGTVQDSAQAALVRSLAARVQGVREVRSDVRVVPSPDTSSGSAPAPTRSRRAVAPPAAPESLPSLEEAG